MVSTQSASAQAGILATENELARYMTFSIVDNTELAETLQDLANNIDCEHTVIGLGESLVNALNREVPGLKIFPAQAGNGIEIPSTPAALWCWLRGSDRGEIFHRSRQIEALLGPSFVLDVAMDSFSYDQNRDLSGYEDGTENPVDDAAIEAAVVRGQGPGLDGGSFVAVQQWLHDFDALDDMSKAQRDDTIGRHRSNNEEFDEAPKSAHVKRAAQESYKPNAFILRRSMPWAEDMDAGLIFVAFGHSFDAFEAILHRMIGKEDGVTDALFNFTRPVSGAYYWCPPVKGSKLDLSALDL